MNICRSTLKNLSLNFLSARFFSVLGISAAALTPFSALGKKEDSPQEKTAPSKFVESPALAKGQLIFDRKMSPYMGANDFITAFRGLEYFEDHAIRNGKYPRGFGAGCVRFLELSLIYNPLAAWSSVAQHEIFGHGYRIRDLGKNVAQVHSYHVEAPFPFSNKPAQGATYFSFSPDITLSQIMAIDIAGIEANYVFSRVIKKQWIQAGSISGRETALYDQNALMGTLYALSLQENNAASHDIAAYLDDLNAAYPNAHLSKVHLNRQMLWNLVDPMLYYNMWASWSYILYGKSVPIPMFRIKSVRFLPNLRTELTPFGIENYFESYFMYNDKLTYFYARQGKHAGQTYWGVGIDKKGIFTRKKTSFDVKLEFWKQPKMALKLGESLPTSSLIGALITVSLNVKFKKFSWFEEFGGKTEGFVPGQSLKKALIGRFGLAFDF